MDCGIPDNIGMHLLIPFACSDAPGCAELVRDLRLPHLEKLLARLAPISTDAASASTLSPPHERALANLYGMAAPDGCIAWAARDAAQSGHAPAGAAWAWIYPVHCNVGAHHIDLADPRSLALEEPESRELLAAMAPYFLEDGVLLHYLAPQRWLACGEVFRGLPSASLDRVVGRDISPWMPSAPTLRRLQNEMQMLLYTHPVTDARSARGQASVNTFWVSGTGALPVGAKTTDDPAMRLVDRLRFAALGHDGSAWARAWAEVDTQECKALLNSLASDPEARLTLCGERNAITFAQARDGPLRRLQRRWTTTTLQTLQDQL